MKVELLAPAGSMSKMQFAVEYGADAVYFAGNRFGLRAYADNFDLEQMQKAVDYLHSRGKKAYITVNIYAEEKDLSDLPEYAKALQRVGVDGVIISDMGVFSIFKENAPKLDLHVSTQANITNSAAAKLWVSLGAKRLVLARETSLNDIRKIRDAISDDIELESFVHGAMCIAYSGRCLLSSFFTERSGNKGECVQCCRWEYDLVEKSRNEALRIHEDDRGTYLLSSKDLCMIEHIKELIDAGVTSMKIEGRMKSEYYVAGVVNAYRRAIDDAVNGKPYNKELTEELEKISHRGYTTGFYYDERGGVTNEPRPFATYKFVAIADGSENGYATVEMRNRFEVGEELEVLSPTDTFNKKLIVTEIQDDKGNMLKVADKVQAKLKIKTDLPLQKYDILRKRI